MGVPRTITHVPDGTQLLACDAAEPSLGIDAAALTVEGGVSALALHAPAGVAGWRVDARLYWRDARIDWAMDADPGSTLWLWAPAAAYAERTQEAWLSRVRLTAVALDAVGAELGRQALGEVWLVWAEGPPPAEPRWLDGADRTIEAPLGAWSTEAKVALGEGFVPLGAPVEVEPPALGSGGAP